MSDLTYTDYERLLQGRFKKDVSMTVDEVAAVVGPEFKEMNENPPESVIRVREEMEGKLAGDKRAFDEYLVEQAEEDAERGRPDSKLYRDNPEYKKYYDDAAAEVQMRMLGRRDAISGKSPDSRLKKTRGYQDGYLDGWREEFRADKGRNPGSTALRQIKKQLGMRAAGDADSDEEKAQGAEERAEADEEKAQAERHEGEADRSDAASKESNLQREGSMTHQRQRLTWGKEAAASGLYGYTKATQNDVEVSVRKIQRQASRIAKAAWGRDERVAAFINAHAKRSSSIPARLLVAAFKEIGPRVASDESDKTAGETEYGSYGYPSKTATLGFNACSELRGFTGRVAYDLHKRRQAKYEKITGFLREHAKANRCRYSKLLLASYPDAPAPVTASEEPTEKTASSPSSVEEWLSWED